jgi:signal peptide peptidase SppA
MPSNPTITAPAADKITDFAPISLARLDEYFSAWSIEESRGALLEQAISGVDWAEHVKQFEERRKDKQAAGDGYGSGGYQLSGGVAVIQVEGTLMKQESSFGGTSTVAIRRQIRQAAADPKVQGLLLVFDSPGGTSAGAGDLAETIADAAKTKTTWGYAEDCCCSAAFFGASQTEKLFANAGAAVGSIGTYMVVRDSSGAYQKSGIKTFVVRAGEHKGTGTPGTEITAEQLAVLQKYVDDTNAPFVAAVARGRKLSAEQAAKLADGRVYVGKAAVEAKLIDGVQSLDQTLADLQKVIQQQSGRKISMSEDNKPKAATSAELRAACKGASSDFILEQLEKGATVQDALSAFVAEQSKQLTAANEAKAKAEKELDEAKQTSTKKLGHDPLKEKPKQAGGEETDADPLEQFEKLVQRHMSGGMARHAAVAKVCREHDDLRQAYVQAHNEEHPHHSR